MEQMGSKLNTQLEAELFESIKSEGIPLKFSAEEMKASEVWCYKTYGKAGRIEKLVDRERALAADRPALWLK